MFAKSEAKRLADWSNSSFGFGARTEQGRANANYGRAFFDGHFKIGGHAHAQMGEGSAKSLFALFFQLAQLTECRADLVGFRAPWGHGHQAVNFQAWQG